MTKDLFLSYITPYLPQLQALAILLAKAIAILLVGFWFARFARAKTLKILSKQDEILANFLTQLVFIICLITTAITTLGTLGVQTTSILTIVGTAGVAIALALKDSLSSIAGGIMLVVLRPFKKGDVIEVGSVVGKVEVVNLFNTSIRLADDRLAILPNRSVINANIINSTDSDKRRIEWVCGVGYGSDIEVVRSTIKEVLENMEKIDKTIPPFVGITDLGASSLNFTIRVWAKIEAGIFNVRSELIENIKIAFDAKGIEIPYNKLDISIKSQD